MWKDLETVDRRFVYQNERTRYISFPLGGIGAGGLALTGSGRLMDWSIRNRPGLQSFNGYSHFAIKAERDGELVDARVLNGPYDGIPAGSPGARKMFDGFGHGANRNSMVGLPHFNEVAFYGRFPVADMTFQDSHFPGGVRMTAFSPFIPHEDRDSSMPVAAFSFEIVNDSNDDLVYTLAATLGNFGNGSGKHQFVDQEGVRMLTLSSADEEVASPDRGDLTIATDAAEVEHTDYHYRGQWFDDLTVFWREFARPGRLPTRHYEEPRVVRHMSLQPEHGTLAARVKVVAGERKTVRFVISWSYPEGDIYWFNRIWSGAPEVEGSTPTWRNYYSTQWADSRASAADMLARWDVLFEGTSALRNSIFGSSAPAELIDAVTGTMAVLRSPTTIRLAEGQIWAWEGVHTNDGSCEGSCTHVWNYQQALAFLFPALERSLREVEFAHNQLPSGGLTFRTKLPLGSGFDRVGPCADGHWGAVIKTYRDWKLCGDTEWLRQLWPSIKRAIEYAWSDDNPDQWDPLRTGILWGRQHHTLDMELFGPNSWLSSMYVAALKAGAAMAEAVGETPFASECARLASSGSSYLNEQLFNGEYFFQRIDISRRAEIAAFESRKAGGFTESAGKMYWSEEHGELKYQVAQGCLTDQILGQWHADVSGIGDLLDPDKVLSALRSIHRYNFRRDLREHVNPARIYAYEDEGGTLLCTWPDQDTLPLVPAPYSEEVWTGLEYMAASHMIGRGLVNEGLDLVRTARARYDGARRNPWSEIECGSYYARSMSAYQLMNAYSGLKVDATRGKLSFNPAAQGDSYRLFWSAGWGWGEIERDGLDLTLRVLGGQLDLRELELTAIGAIVLPAVQRLVPGDSFSARIGVGRIEPNYGVTR